MTKRKHSSGDAAPAKEPEAADVKEEKEQEETDPYAPGPIDTNPLQFLIAPTDFSTFTSDVWERKPLHIPADAQRKKYFDGIFNFDALVKLADGLEAGALLLLDQDPGPKGDALTLDDDIDDSMIEAIGPLMFGRDVVAVRYTDGERQTIDADVADSDTLKALYESAGATLQVHQPQRYINGLWRLVAALEAQAGCLVGCNAYITPKGGQGLAPHHDDVELFVCQTQGTKKWRLYKPVNGFELPSKCSGDLPQEDLGEPILEVTMKPGDVLYVPRGTVHQAEAQEEGSCHLTISTYQKWTWGSLAAKLLETAAQSDGSEDNALPLALRKGLPLGFLFKHGLQADLQTADATALAAASRPDAACLAAGLRALADQLEARPVQLLAPAVDELSVDFLANRMPPHPCQLPDQGEEPTLEDSIACRGKNLFRLVLWESDDEDDDEEDDEEEDEEKEEDEEEEDEEEAKGPMVKLVTCLGNSRYHHMISIGEEDDDEEDEHVHGPGCGHHMGHDSDEDDEDEEIEEEEEEEAVVEDEKEEGGKKKSAGKKGEKKEEAKAEEKEEEEKKGAGKKGGKKAKEEEKEEEEKEEEGDEAEIVEMDVDELEGGDSDDDGDDDEDGGEEEKLIGPIFPAVYAPVLAEVLSSTSDKPLSIKKLKVPGDNDEERLRLAQILYEAGFVVTVPGGKKDPSPAKEEKKAAGKAEEAGEGKKGKKGTKGKEEAKAEEGEGKAKAKGKAKEEAEAKGPSPPAKKAKKGK